MEDDRSALSVVDPHADGERLGIHGGLNIARPRLPLDPMDTAGQKGVMDMVEAQRGFLDVDVLADGQIHLAGQMAIGYPVLPRFFERSNPAIGPWMVQSGRRNEVAQLDSVFQSPDGLSGLLPQLAQFVGKGSVTLSPSW